MYGLEGILGNLVTSVATPAVGGIMGDIASSAVEDQLLKEITQTTVGALSGAAVGAGLGALTGGKSGALSGALTGGVGGGVGGYNAPQISQMFGMNQSAVPPQGIQPQASPLPPQTTAQYTGNDPVAQLLQPKQSPAQAMALQNRMPTAPQSPIQNIQTPTPQPVAPTAAGGFKDYTKFLKENYEPLAGGFFLGSAYGANQDTQEQGKQRQHEQILADLIESQKARRFSRSTWGYADGGPVEVGLANPQISVHFPAWAQEKIQREGGLAAIQPGIKQGMAQGGYINLQPMGDTMHPQGLIPKAQPYAAAAPQRREVVQDYGDTYARGGLIDGVGDGMSDDIPANISGKEEVRVADGEYVIPREIAAKYGPEKLKAMMTKVRAAAHAKKGKQIVQGAAQREFIKTLSGVKA